MNSIFRSLFAFLVLTAAPAAAADKPAFELPAGESRDVWAETLALAGLAAEMHGDGPWVAVRVEGDKWRLVATDARGVRREVVVAAPRDQTSREDLAILAASLVRPVSGIARASPPAVSSLPPPAVAPPAAPAPAAAAPASATRSSPLATSPLAPSPLAPSPLAPSPVATSAVATSPVATSPVATSPVATSPVAPSPIATSPVAPSPVATSPVATSPVATSPVATSPVAPPPVDTSPVAPPPVDTSPDALVPVAPSLVVPSSAPSPITPPPAASPVEQPIEPPAAPSNAKSRLHFTVNGAVGLGLRSDAIPAAAISGGVGLRGERLGIGVLLGGDSVAAIVSQAGDVGVSSLHARFVVSVRPIAALPWELSLDGGIARVNVVDAVGNALAQPIDAPAAGASTGWWFPLSGPVALQPYLSAYYVGRSITLRRQGQPEVELSHVGASVGVRIGADFSKKVAGKGIASSSSWHDGG